MLAIVALYLFVHEFRIFPLIHAAVVIWNSDASTTKGKWRWQKDKNQFVLFSFQPDAPFIPKVTGAGDTQNFDEYDEEPIKVSNNLHCAKEFDNF